ncbi:hypothetical protein PRZ48_013928 [Zasmidium cellare]|uniref:EthD domain-containing protein n=1 Tax=Zasmidium cellare TaxID=395010 RepID=A0ABR0DZI3_ZASCE|nr:hypothetical protein PRZ48_013928 [Zasmidium cellare]
MVQQRGSVLKFCMLIKRRQDMSEEDFHKYWTEVHAPIVEKWLAKHGVIRYVQYHTPTQTTTQSTEVWTGLGGANVLQFDGHVELTVPNVECLKRALEDAYYQSDVLPDEGKFIDAANSFRTCGWEEVKIEVGNVLRETQ